MPFISVNKKKFFLYKASGATDGPIPGLSVFAIHGLGSSHAFYLPIFDHLTKHGVQCFAHDTYGSAQSPLDSPSPQTVASMADDAKAIMDSLGLQASKTIVVGHSMGGMVACELASKSRYAGVVLLGPVHPNPGAAKVFDSRIATVKANGMEAMADVIPEAATGSKSTASQRAWIRTLLLSQGVPGYTSLCSVIANASAPDYGRIRSPLLLVAGSEDKSAPLLGCETIIDSCGTDPGSKKLVVLDGIGHWHCVEAPHEIGQLVVDFLAKL